MAVFAPQITSIPITEQSSRPTSPSTTETQTVISTDFEDSTKISDDVTLNSNYIFCSGSSGYSSSSTDHSPIFKDSFLQQQNSTVSNDQFESQVQESHSKDTSASQLPLPARKMAKPDSYKTVMCKGWLEMGGCSFGENCRFAHGEEELRPSKIPIDNPKYKTKLCDKYTKTGVCPYGERCLFIHPKALNSNGFASNPYIHPDRMAQLLKERGSLLMNSKPDKHHPDTPLSSRVSTRMRSWPINMLRSFRPEKSVRPFCEHFSQSRTPSPCANKLAQEIEKQMEMPLINPTKPESLSFDLGQTLIDIPNNVTVENDVPLATFDEDSSKWSARISEVFDYAIETDNMARSLAKNLSDSF